MNDEKIRREEAKTHRHLVEGELVQFGDVYGGDPWGFLFMIGSPQVQSPQPGEPCDGLLGYRVRRPLK